MLAILKREFNAYFSSAIGFVFLAVFYFFSGLFFWLMLSSYSARLGYVFDIMFYIILILIPILTMKLFSDEKRLKTEQALLTAPVSLFSIVFAKFLAAFIVYLLALSIFLIFALVVSFFTVPAWTVFFGNLVGILLLGCALISIGVFISSLTESQVIAAVGSIAVSIFLLIIGVFAQSIPFNFLANAIFRMSFYSRYSSFITGLFDLRDIFFFLSVTAVFLFLAVRVLDKKRWS